MNARLVWPKLALSSAAGESYDVGAMVSSSDIRPPENDAPPITVVS
jgi:hypothetical protein